MWSLIASNLFSVFFAVLSVFFVLHRRSRNRLLFAMKVSSSESSQLGQPNSPGATVKSEDNINIQSHGAFCLNVRKFEQQSRADVSTCRQQKLGLNQSGIRESRTIILIGQNIGSSPEHRLTSEESIRASKLCPRNCQTSGYQSQ